MSKQQTLSVYQQQADKLMVRYHQCDPHQQAILRVLALIYGPVNLGNLNFLLKQCAEQQLFDQTFESLNLSNADRGALKVRQLVKAEDFSIEIEPLLRPVLLRLCAEQDNISKLHLTMADAITLQGLNQQQVTDFYQQSFVACEFVSGDYQKLEYSLFDQKTGLPKYQVLKVLTRLCFYPFQVDFFRQLPAHYQYLVLERVTQDHLYERIDPQDLIEIFKQTAHLDAFEQEKKCWWACCHIIKEELYEAQALLTDVEPTVLSAQAKGWLAFYQNNMDASIRHFEQSKLIRRKENLGNWQVVGGFPAPAYCLALLTQGVQGDKHKIAQLHQQILAVIEDRDQYKDFVRVHMALRSFLESYDGLESFYFMTDYRTEYYDLDFFMHWCHVMAGLCYVWLGQKIEPRVLERLERFLPQSISAGDHLCARAIARLIFSQNPQHSGAKKFLRNHWSISVDLFALVKPKEAWLSALDKLIALDEDSKLDSQTSKNHRLAWFIQINELELKIVPKEQKLGKNSWSKGRVVALKRLAQQSDLLDYLTAADKKIIEHIRMSYEDGFSYRYYNKESYELTGSKALAACMGHPLVFAMHQPNTAIEIVESEPEVLMSENKSHYKLNMVGVNEEVYDENDLYSFEQIGPNRYNLIRFNQKHLDVAKIIGPHGLEVPKDAKDKVVQSIQALAKITNVQAQVKSIEGLDTGLESVEADSQLYVNIYPQQGGLIMECHVQPLGVAGPVLVPGHGHSMITASIDGKRLKTDRDLAFEQQQIELLQQQCPEFNYMAEHQIFLDNLEVALHCLEQLEQVQKQKTLPNVVLQWPKSKPIKLTETQSSQQMSLSVRKNKDWFALDGELKLDEDKVIDLKQLLQLVENAQGRFVPLGDEQYLALTNTLRNQLEALAGVTEDGRFHPLATPVIDEHVQGMTLKSNTQWLEQVNKIKSSFELNCPLPNTLQANLRSYQLEGFEWACRLAHWGAGACLADDMGLGKTLQALAVILSRAPQGPTLVLAPMSVCFNWQEEAHRFTPTLKVKMLGAGLKKNRGKVLDNIGPYDLLVCSYGLLQTEGEALAQVQWRTMVADEAQALKNPQAKRTKMAMQLKSDFAMVTTGTPIENNLTELWSLFRFINPGLFGSAKAFTHRFAKPIENAAMDSETAQAASQALRKLISPFILRRLKSEVLTELPSRTEINLHVELSEQEQTFYEALRRKAVETMLLSEDKPGQKRIKALAEIMRLRRACCHPKLVMEESQIDSSKLKVFDNLIDELKQGNHKALVFSQFVGHLDILRAHLEDRGISFQYLDGSTSAAKRKKAVNDFQAGKGELFLISLKAGGAGLNLTAADYVIHMDPWWNPAVEDQASDRAHRMGQTRPVTIYRLISQNTIEDKIVSLHQQKRDLANSLLQGTDSTGNMSYEDILALLQDDIGGELKR